MNIGSLLNQFTQTMHLWILNTREDTLRNITIVGIIIALVGALHDFLNSTRRLIRSTLTIAITVLSTTAFCIVLLLIPTFFFWHFHFMGDTWPVLLLTGLMLAGMVGTFHGVFILFTDVNSREVPQNKSSSTPPDEKQTTLKAETTGASLYDQRTDQTSIVAPKEASHGRSKKRFIRILSKRSWLGIVTGFILGALCTYLYWYLIITIFVKPAAYDRIYYRILEAIFSGFGAILGCVWRGWIRRPTPAEESIWKHLYQYPSLLFTRVSNNMTRFFKWLKICSVQEILPTIRYPVDQFVSIAIVHPWHYLTNPPVNVKDTAGQSESPLPLRPPAIFHKENGRHGMVLWLIIALVLYGFIAISFGVSVALGYSPRLSDAGIFLIFAIIAGTFILTGWFASGIAFFIHWSTHFSKRIGKIGIFFTVISLLLTAIEPSILEAKQSLDPHPPIPTPTIVTPTRTPLPSTFTYNTFYSDSSAVDAVAWSPDGKRIAAAGSNNVHIWNAFTGKSVLTYSNHTAEVTAIAWSPDGKRIASASADNTVRVWNAITMKTLVIYRGHSSAVDAVAWSPDGRRIASAGGNPNNPAGGDNTVRIWDARTGKTYYSYQGHSEWVKTIAWSPDGKYIASGGYDRTVQVWAANPSVHFHHFIYRGHYDRVYTVAWSPDGKRIASAGGDPNIENADNTVQVWDAFTGSHAFTYNGHIYDVNSVSWSPNGKYIASCSDTAQVWDSDTGELIFTYHGYDRYPTNVLAVEWSPDGKYIASGGSDGTVQVWHAPVP